MVIRSSAMPFLLFLLLRDGREMFGRTVRLVPMEPQRRGEPFADETLARQP
jgi:predicted PurR-regulated permease PerM